MSFDLPSTPNPRAELEAKVTALLLGELPAEEAARLREVIAKDDDLRELQERLSATLDLLRETAATPAGEMPAQPAPLRLSAERREKLLAHFKTIRPEEFEAAPKRSFKEWIVLTGAAAAVVLILVSLLLPASSSSKGKAFQVSMLQNLRLLDSAKRQWAEEQGKSPADVPTMKNLQPYFGHGAEREQIGNGEVAYSLGPVGQPPSAQYKGRVITLPREAENLAANDQANLGLKAPQEQNASASTSQLDALRMRRQEEDRTGGGGGQQAASGLGGAQQQIALPQSGTSQLADNNGQGADFIASNGQAQFAFQNASSQIQASAPAATLNGWQGQAPVTSSGQAVETAQRNISNSGEANVTFFAENANSDALANNNAGVPQTFNRIETVPSVAALPPIVAPAPASGDIAGESSGFAAKIQNRGELQANKKGPELSWNAPSALEAPALEQAAGVRTESGRISESPTRAPAKMAPKVMAEAAESKTDKHVIVLAGKDSFETGRDSEKVVREQVTTVDGSVSAPAASAQPSNGSATTALDTNNVYSISAVGYINVHLDSNYAIIATTPLQVTNNSLQAASAPATPPPATDGLPEGAGRIQVAAAENKDKTIDVTDGPLPRPMLPAPVPQPEVLTSVNAFTTFSLNVSDVAFKLAQASLQNGLMPEAASMRSEEFINAFDYRDAEPAPGAPVGFAWERAADPFAHHRDFLRFSIKTAAQGRQEGRPLNLVLIVDKSGSMERADRVEIIAKALGALAGQLRPGDTLSVVVFARTARLFVDGVPGSQAGEVAKDLRRLTPEGGTNLEEAMRLAYATALRHYLANGENRVVLLTDGAANLGNVDPEALKLKVEANRKQGIALDCFGVGWDGYNDQLLEKLSRAGNGRYGFVNTPEEAATEFAGKLAGALRVAAADIKVQVEFNPGRVVSYRQIGYAKDQLKKEDFRDNSVKAAQIGAAEAGNALYTVEVNAAGEGPIGTVHVRFRVPGTETYEEHEWTVPYAGAAVALEQASPAMRLTAVAAEFSEWLAGSPFAGEATPDRLLHYLRGVPQVYGADERPGKLEWMIRQAKSISGK